MCHSHPWGHGGMMLIKFGPLGAPPPAPPSALTPSLPPLPPPSPPQIPSPPSPPSPPKFSSPLSPPPSAWKPEMNPNTPETCKNPRLDGGNSVKTLKNAADLPEEASKCSYFHKMVIKTKMVISWRAQGLPNILKFWKIQGGGLYLLTVGAALQHSRPL